VPDRLAVFGEVGLAGEVRAVQAAPARVAESLRLGYERVLLPAGNLDRLQSPRGCELLPLVSLEELAERALESP